jgi:nitrogen regulatory protein PII-like uncharacterized protein
MTIEDIIRMAKEARFYINDNEAYSPSNQEDFELTEHLERFAKLVAEHEREACVKAIEAQIGWDMDDPESTAIEAIRARGQA